MEILLESGLTITALSAIVYGLTSAVYTALPMTQLGDYTKAIKLLGAFLVALGITL